mmetsp:Transcript_39643/g.55300  ORF Transcript_39643/g.55300 Transcript_39643/m.55300 type:complete len:315 (-) Transcript_39643:32-976(-)|eukprot:s1613_g28.t1
MSGALKTTRALCFLASLFMDAHGDDIWATQLLQRKLVLSGTATEFGLPEERLKAAEPLWWFHCPKCGTSFINALINLPGVCPGLALHSVDSTTLGPCFGPNFSTNVCPSWCSGMECIFPPHQGLGNYTAKEGRLVGFFRDPDQRLLSMYHSWGNGPGCFDWADTLKNMTKPPFLEYADLMKGGMTYQLTQADQRSTAGTLLDVHRPMTSDDAKEASRRVKEGFAFVGLTEEWDTSICLFHKMFGGHCHAEEFVDIRPTSSGKDASVDYDASELMGFHDDIDEVVYSAALEVFRANIVLYNVSQDSCRSCFSVRS